jgi:hypothetical protein
MTSTSINSQSVVKAQGMGTGLWTFWTKTGTDEPVAKVDITASLSAAKLSECLKRCASDSLCAGINYAGEARGGC